MSFFFIDPALFHQYKDEVLRLSNSFQININEHFSAEKRKGGMSDLEIAEKLDLEEQVVREIRIVAERDYYPIDEWQKAIEFKDHACRSYQKKGLAYATKKYAKKKSKP